MKTKMNKLGGKATIRAAAAALTDRQHSTDLRREIDLMLQDLTVEQAKIAVYPQLDKKIQVLVRSAVLIAFSCSASTDPTN